MKCFHLINSFHVVKRKSYSTYSLAKTLKQHTLAILFTDLCNKIHETAINDLDWPENKQEFEKEKIPFCAA